MHMAAGNQQPPASALTIPGFLDEADSLAALLRRLPASKLRTLMKTSERLTEQTIQQFSQWRKSAHRSDGRPSIFTFRGDVYGPIGVDEMTGAELKFAQRRLRILSGLYGILRPLDLIQAYRLEMAARMETPAGKNLYDFWGDRIAMSLEADLKQEGSGVLINLASNEYLKAARVGQLQAQIVQPVFKEFKNGAYKVIAIYAKRARGLMTGFILKNAITALEELRQFDLEGYCYRPEMSTDEKWVFTRKS